MADQNELMITLPKYKNYLLLDCKTSKSPSTRSLCTKAVTPLKLGDVNYISTRGKRAQENICKHIQSIKPCARMCKTFFEFYPEPNRYTCLFVDMRWK